MEQEKTALQQVIDAYIERLADLKNISLKSDNVKMRITSYQTIIRDLKPFLPIEQQQIEKAFKAGHFESGQAMSDLIFDNQQPHIPTNSTTYYNQTYRK